ncbi:hypothetical protein PCANC_22949 [Puccinia coronata f. sp. avenae]|uniref:Uncharacterized protein n=1 Tax=Puccinia coronata f. sp. avenae TaxID=200324 RepID=A0A2N5SQH5_9BASI|nr:hypothetical protein PCANC_22949 [Puccinia coronata f. sp. avenae]
MSTSFILLSSFWFLNWKSTLLPPSVTRKPIRLTLHISPRAPSIEYLASRHPDDADSDDSTDDEPSASKRPPLFSPTPSPQVLSPDYLALTPSEIDWLLHDVRPFRYKFVYTPNHIRGTADNIFRKLSAFLSFYAPASEQEAAARIYLYRTFQSHFNWRL